MFNKQFFSALQSCLADFCLLALSAFLLRVAASERRPRAVLRLAPPACPNLGSGAIAGLTSLLFVSSGALGCRRPEGRGVSAFPVDGGHLVATCAKLLKLIFEIGIGETRSGFREW